MVPSKKIGRIRYFDEQIYHMLTDIVRNNHAAHMLDVTIFTIAALKKCGVLHEIHIPGARMTFPSYTQMHDPHIVEIVEARKLQSHKPTYWMDVDEHTTTGGITEYQRFYRCVLKSPGKKEIMYLQHLFQYACQHEKSALNLRGMLLTAYYRLIPEEKERYNNIIEKQVDKYHRGKTRINEECRTILKEFIHLLRAVYLQRLHALRYSSQRMCSERNESSMGDTHNGERLTALAPGEDDDGISEFVYQDLREAHEEARLHTLLKRLGLCV